MTNNKILAVIPARSGSKSIKNKNLIKVNGRSLINIAISKAVKSKLFSKVLISTDSQKYADEAIKSGLISEKEYLKIVDPKKMVNPI